MRSYRPLTVPSPAQVCFPAVPSELRKLAEREPSRRPEPAELAVGQLGLASALPPVPVLSTGLAPWAASAVRGSRLALHRRCSVPLPSLDLVEQRLLMALKPELKQVLVREVVLVNRKSQYH